jgi:hypothetical protein
MFSSVSGLSAEGLEGALKFFLKIPNGSEVLFPAARVGS